MSSKCLIRWLCHNRHSIYISVITIITVIITFSMNVRNWTGYTHTESRGLTQRSKKVRNRARMQLAETLRESHTQRGEASSKSPLLRRLFSGRSLATDRSIRLRLGWPQRACSDSGWFSVKGKVERILHRSPQMPHQSWHQHPGWPWEHNESILASFPYL